MAFRPPPRLACPWRRSVEQEAPNYPGAPENPGVDWEAKESGIYYQGTQSPLGLTGSSNGFTAESNESRYLAVSLTFHHLLPLAPPVHCSPIPFPFTYPSPLLSPICCLCHPSPTSLKEYIPSLTEKIGWNPGGSRDRERRNPKNEGDRSRLHSGESKESTCLWQWKG